MTDQYGQVTSYYKDNEVVWDREDLSGQFYKTVSLGNYTAFKVFMTRVDSDKLFVGVELKGCYAFNGWAHWEYVKEKLLLGESDARNMADFINAQNNKAGELQGRYDKSLVYGELDEQEVRG